MRTSTLLSLPIFKTALLFEILSNLSSLPTLLFFPKTALSLILSSPPPSHTPTVTAALELQTQIFGCLVLALTIPLVLSYPSPKVGPDGNAQRGFRKAAYLTLGAGEAGLGVLFGSKFLQARSGVDVGWSGTALGVATAAMVAFGALRVVFLVVSPEWLEDDHGGSGREDEGLWDGKQKKRL